MSVCPYIGAPSFKNLDPIVIKIGKYIYGVHKQSHVAFCFKMTLSYTSLTYLAIALLPLLLFLLSPKMKHHKLHYSLK